MAVCSDEPKVKETIIEVAECNEFVLLWNQHTELWNAILRTKTNQSLIYVYALQSVIVFRLKNLYFSLRQPINLICSKPKRYFDLDVGMRMYLCACNK